MPPPPMNAVSGRKLLKVRESKLSMTRAALAIATNRSPESIRRYERDQINAVPGEFLRKLAELLGEDFGVLRLRLMPDVGDVADTATVDIVAESGEAVRRSNVVRTSEVAVPDIPLFDLPLAAGGWKEVHESMVVQDAGTLLRGRFRVRLSGDSMMPLYDDGQVVEFQYDHGTEVGRDYYVQLNDGTATFKQLYRVERDGIILVARNRQKYPKPLHAPRELILRHAVALAKVDFLRPGG